jgi:hypothetical protein
MRPQRIGRRLAKDPTMPPMTLHEALRLGAESLRADALRHPPAHYSRIADAGAAAAILEREAFRPLEDRLRLEADAWRRDRPAIHRTLELAGRVLRLAATEGDDAADRVAAEVSAALDAIDREAIATRADADRVAAMMAEGDEDPTVEDRVLAGESDRGVVAAMIAGANEGERLRVLAAAAEILADLVRDDVVRLSSRDLSAIREALRLDHATPI